MVRPLFSYYGGKQRLVSKIVPLLPRHTVYVEPFCGGASVFFAKPWPPVSTTDQYREVLNDRDVRIVNLYRVVQCQDSFAQFVRLVSVPFSRAVYDAAKQRNKNVACDPDGRDVQAAADYWNNVQMAFGNILHGGWGTSVFGRNCGATQTNRVKNLPRFLDRMLSVNLECDDALAVIKRWDSPQTCFYCDPPYPKTDQGDYGGYSQTDFEKLCVVLEAAQGSFLLSCYDNSAPPSSWERFEFKTVTSASASGLKNRDKTAPSNRADTGRTEVVWRVDRSANARKSLRDIWDTWETSIF